MLAGSNLWGQHIFTRKFSPCQSVNILHDIVYSFENYHPGYYRYHTPADWKHYIDSLRLTITDSLTERDLYRKLKPLVSRIGCLHTDLSTALSYKGYLDRYANLIPLRLHFEKDRAFVVKNYSVNKAIRSGDEVIRINGKPTAHLLQTLLPAIPSDGYNQTMKYLALDHQFPTWYRSMIETADSFKVGVLQGGKEITYTLPAARKKDIAEQGFLKEFVYLKQLEFKIENNSALLTIHSFANSAIKKGDQQFRKFVDQALYELHSKNISHLILDLRYNTGGSDANAAYLASCFFSRPFRYWDRIEVTERIAGKTKGIARIWYRKPLQKDSMWLWQKGKRARDFDFYELQQPARNNYKGKVYVLINGFCMSSCADLVAVLKQNKKAIFIGEETGGGFQGNNSGIMPGVNLKPSKMVLTLPLQKYVTAVDPSVNYGRGTIPDYTVTPTVQDIVQGTDRQMNVAMDLITQP